LQVVFEDNAYPGVHEFVVGEPSYRFAFPVLLGFLENGDLKVSREVIALASLATSSDMSLDLILPKALRECDTISEALRNLHNPSIPLSDCLWYVQMDSISGPQDCSKVGSFASFGKSAS
jgi:hypothetical protein